jgi:hypothetical protein
MPSERSNSLNTTVDRILRERLNQFEVPNDVITALKEEILAFFERPEKKPFGACVMTPAASIAADQARKEGKAQRGGSKPEII